MRDIVYPAADSCKNSNETCLRTNPYTNPTIRNGSDFHSHTTFGSNPGRIERIRYSESRIEGNEQSVEHRKLDKLGSVSIDSSLGEERVAEQFIPFDKANDNKAIKGTNGKKTKPTTAQSDSSAKNHLNIADHGNVGSSKILAGSAYSSIPTTDCKVESVYFSSSDSATESHVSANCGEERNFESRRIDVTVSENYDLVDDGGRYIVPPPKYSHPCSVALYDKMSPSTAFYNEQKDLPLSSKLTSTSHSPHQTEKVMTLSRSQQHNTNHESGNDIGTCNSNSNHSNAVNHELGSNDDDSILKFPDNQMFKLIEQGRDKHHYDNGEKNLEKFVNLTEKVPRRSRHRRKQRMVVETVYTDDDTSIENRDAATALHSISLQERSHQAWKSRQRKNSTVRSNSRLEKISNVSFGATNTVHHFESDIRNRPERMSKYRGDASVDRSLDSEYTKTLESEVEDMIKDILFIGNPRKSKPGRRKYRDKSEIDKMLLKDRPSRVKMDNNSQTVKSAQSGRQYRAKFRRVNDAPSLHTPLTSDIINETYESKNDLKGNEVHSLASTLSRDSSVDSNTVETFRTKESVTEDPFNKVIGFVEDGLSVMTSAIGYAFGDQTASEYQEVASYEARKTTNEYDIFESCGIRIGDQKAMTGPDTRATDLISKDLNVVSAGKVDSIDSNIPLLMSKKVKKKTEIYTGEEHESSRQALKLGSDSGLSRLAIYAARSAHKLQGAEYDESYTIDMYKEVRTCHVTLELPLGSKSSFL